LRIKFAQTAVCTADITKPDGNVGCSGSYQVNLVHASN